MSEPSSAELNLPGLQLPSNPEPAPKRATAPAPPRVKPVNRSQMIWREVDVERLIEEDHPARAIWELSGQLDLTGFYAPIAAVQGTAGRTPWDPRLLTSLWVYAYSRGISSAREIARRCSFDPGFQWLCGLEQINHHTLSDFRVAHGPALQKLFVELLGVLSAEGLVSLERVMHDGTKIKACASGQSFHREANLQAHLKAAQAQVQALSEELSEEPKRQQAAQQRAVRERQKRVERALEELEVLRQSKDTAKEKEAVRVSVSDPTSRVMKQPDGGYAPSYNVQLSTEASHKIIVGTGVTQQGNDQGQLETGVEQIFQNMQTLPQQVVTDGGFTSRQTILAMAQKGIDFIGSLPDTQSSGASSLKAHGIDPAFSNAAFTYEEDKDIFRCPSGQTLRRVSEDRRRVGLLQYQYRAEGVVCEACPFKARCCPQVSRQGRSINRSVEVDEVTQFREKMQTDEAKSIYRQRAPVAEFPNAWLKEKLGLRQFRVRGLVKVGLEVLWAALTYNLQQWIRLCWLPRLAGAQN